MPAVSCNRCKHDDRGLVRMEGIRVLGTVPLMLLEGAWKPSPRHPTMQGFQLTGGEDGSHERGRKMSARYFGGNREKRQFSGRLASE